MIRKIESSLFAKVFLLTALFMLFIGLVVYGALAVLTPRTYANELNGVLDAQAQAFVAELEQLTLKDSGGAFDRFLQTDDVAYLELYDGGGRPVSLPSNHTGGGYSEATTETAGAPAPTLSNNYYFSFAGTDARYLLIVYGSAAQVAELRRAFIGVLPFLLLVVLAAALLTAWLYSRLITAPVLRISRISKQLSDLQFSWRLEETRADELGTLEKSLNVLSQKLSATLCELQKANEQLKADIAREKALEQAQLDFFSAASHELKTPVTIIKGQLEGMLLGVGAYKDREKYLARSLKVANTLETMVQELLTVARLQAAPAAFQPEPVDGVAVIRNYLRETEDWIVNKDLRIELDMPDSAVVMGNRLLLEKVYSNLIGNAIQYSPPGALLRISIQKQQEKYRFCVENSGAHIQEDALPRLFDAFYRAEHSRSRETGGSGLGLYIVQKVLQQHGSVCQVCNTETGVLFSFVL